MVKEHSKPDNTTALQRPTGGHYLSATLDTLKAYVAQTRRYPVLSREEEPQVARLVYEDQDIGAFEKLTVSNLRLVVKIAMTYSNTYLNVLDLIQEGNVGLLHAVKKYNPYKGTKFSTYAAFWIRAYMLKYIMDSWSLVKVGTTQSQRKLFYRLNKEKRELNRLGLYPDTKVLANNLQVKEGDILDMETRLSCNDVYLEDPVSDDGSDTLMDRLSTDEDAEEIAIEKETLDILARKVKEFKTTLSEREACVLDYRLMAEQPKTLAEIGTEFRISRERVRQIERKIIEKAKVRFSEDMMDETRRVVAVQ